MNNKAKKSTDTSFHLYFRSSNKKAVLLERQISEQIKKNWPHIEHSVAKPSILFVLGGDGTILEAAYKYRKINPVVVGINLGNLGFLSSISDDDNLTPALEDIFMHRCKITERMMLSANIKRRGRIIFKTTALNEVTIINPLGMVEIEARVENHPIQYVRGTGIMVSTATGSTALNMSAHGPIVMPHIKCMILTELLDHNIPTPSMVIDEKNTVLLKINDFRKRGILSISKTGKKIDVLLIADGNTVFAIEKDDAIEIKDSGKRIRFAEFGNHYFFKNLKSKFAFR